MIDDSFESNGTTKVNAEVYTRHLRRELIPAIERLYPNNDFIFVQDGWSFIPHLPFVPRLPTRKTKEEKSFCCIGPMASILTRSKPSGVLLLESAKEYGLRRKKGGGRVSKCGRIESEHSSQLEKIDRHGASTKSFGSVLAQMPKSCWNERWSNQGIFRLDLLYHSQGR